MGEKVTVFGHEIEISSIEPKNKCLDLTVELWNTFIQIKGLHGDDCPDFRHHLHAIQNILYTHKYKTEVPNNRMLKP